MVMGACPGQIPISCVPLTLMVTATMVRACRYSVEDTLSTGIICGKLPSEGLDVINTAVLNPSWTDYAIR